MVHATPHGTQYASYKHSYAGYSLQCSRGTVNQLFERRSTQADVVADARRHIERDGTGGI